MPTNKEKRELDPRRFWGQNMNFSQGKRIYDRISKRVYRMDGTDGRGATMILTLRDYATYRMRGDSPPEDRYYYVMPFYHHA